MTGIITFFDVCDECKSDTGALWSIGIELGNRMLCRPCYELTLEDIDCGSNYHTLCDSMKCRRCYDKSLASCEKAFSIDFSEVSRLKLKLPRFVFKKSGRGYPFVCEVGHRWMLKPLKLNGVNRWCSHRYCLNERKKKTCLANHGVEYSFQSEEIKKKSEETCMKKYGVKNSMQCPEIREKAKQTWITNLGVDNPMKSEESKQKSRVTCMETYGTEYALQSEEVKNKSKATLMIRLGVEHSMQAEEVKEKYRATCMEKYGTENPMQDDDVKEKARSTCIERYGTEYYIQSEESKTASLAKYGTENPMQSKAVQEKGQQTCMVRYGYKYPLQCPEIFSKRQKSAFEFREYEFPSGRVTEVQGYEDIALDALLELYDESVIKTSFDDPLTINYCSDDGEQRVYYPDIFITSENMIVEVKSTYTYEVDKEKNESKARACVEQGYKFQFYIIDKKLSIDVQDR